MSNIARVAGQAANTLVKPLEVEDVFSTYLYEGSNTLPLVQTTGIDGSEGALVWIKNRGVTHDHILFDTEQNTNIETNNSNAGLTSHDTTITSTGFSLNNGDGRYNDGTTPGNYVSWTFRKAPKFFDVVTYTGNGVSQNISHNLGAIPGCVVIKRTDSATDWLVWHRKINGTDADGSIKLNSTAAKQNGQPWDWDGVTDAYFPLISDWTEVNASGGSYVAYFFAHNDGDGGFGPNGDADIIKCGSYAGNATSVDLGFEPQFIIVKRTDSAENWMMFDSMRGWNADGDSLGWLMPNKTSAEGTLTNGNFGLTSTGFEMSSGYTPLNNGSSSSTYIYIAIRRGTAVPTSATEVFAVAPRTANAPGFKSGFVTDMFFRKSSTSSTNWFGSDRLRQGRFTYMNDTTAEAGASNFQFDYMNGVTTDTTATSTLYAWMWKRAPKYMDVTCHTSNGQPAQEITHNLGVVPEMAWIRDRTGANWFVYHKDLTSGYNLILNSSGAEVQSNSGTAAAFNSTYWTPGDNGVLSGGGNIKTYVAYLFASLDGVSKVGGFTTTGSDVNVDCGFSAGARFVLWKRTDSAGSWNLMDSERGIVAGNDPFLNLNQTSGENDSVDLIDPYSSGFTVVGGGLSSGGTYIFYAIA